jgi:thiol:disulfide interchange protein
MTMHTAILRSSLFLWLGLVAGPVFGQTYNPLKWTFESRNLQGDEFELIFQGTLEKGWYTYSQFLQDDGPVPTSLTFESTNFELLGKAVEEGNKITVDKDPVFDIPLTKFKDRFIIKQRVRVKDYSKPITGYLNAMCCDQEKCLPPKDYEFAFVLKKGAAPTDGGAPAPETVEPVTPEPGPAETAPGGGTTAETLNGLPVFNPKREAIDLDHPVSNCSADAGSGATADGTAPAKEKKNLFFWLLLGLGGGLFALLTPCIYPMIPLTVSFFTKSSQTRAQGIRNALIYGGSITGIYVLLGLLASFTIGAAGLNSLSTNAVVNVVLFVVLTVFAFSFFGFFELTLPSSWTTQTDSRANQGGLLGVFFMAFTLVLVSFSCTGPIAASLMTQALEEPASAAMGMLGFGLALGLPFGLFAAFPGWLQSMPKSGGWMNNVKIFLGFLELALAFKFFSTADLTMHWGILKYELFIGLWALIALLNALYFFGLFRFTPSAPKAKRSPGNLLVGALSLGLSVYLCTGFGWNTETCSYQSPAITSGMAPPTYYAFRQCETACPNEGKCPIGICCFRDYAEGLAYAKANQKMIMIDFTGYGCVNCRKMEEHVWVLPDIYKLLKNDLVLISLYVDDRAPLAQPEVDPEGNKLRTQGSKWTVFETVNFKYNAQPYYALLSPDEQLLNAPRGYTPDAQEFEAFLRCGFDALERVCPACHQPN